MSWKTWIWIRFSYLQLKMWLGLNGFFMCVFGGNAAHIDLLNCERSRWRLFSVRFDFTDKFITTTLKSVLIDFLHCEKNRMWFLISLCSFWFVVFFSFLFFLLLSYMFWNVHNTQKCKIEKNVFFSQKLCIEKMDRNSWI